MSADQVIWSEQGRLHLAYTAVVAGDATNSTITIQNDADGNDRSTTHGIRPGDQLLLANSTTTCRAYVKTATGNATVVAIPYGSGDHLNDVGFGNSDALRVLVYGSEMQKASSKRARANKPAHKSLTNKPVILRDYYEISGSDASQIGWVEVSGEEGQTGYLWYVKAEAETRSRFADYLEMTMIEAEKQHADSIVDDELGGITGTAGTEGLFSAITTRGHVSTGVTCLLYTSPSPRD